MVRSQLANTPDARPATANTQCSLSKGLEAIGIATLVIQPDLEVISANNYTQELLGRSTTLSITGTTLKCGSVSDLPLLRASIHDAIFNHQPSILSFGSNDRCNLKVAVQPLDSPPLGELTACRLLIRPQPHYQVKLLRKKLADQFGITTAENEVLSMMMLGNGTRTIAERRATSSETIRSQIKALCAKTNSSGQLGLLAFTVSAMAETV